MNLYDHQVIEAGFELRLSDFETGILYYLILPTMGVQEAESLIHAVIIHSKYINCIFAV